MQPAEYGKLARHWKQRHREEEIQADCCEVTRARTVGSSLPGPLPQSPNPTPQHTKHHPGGGYSPVPTQRVGRVLGSTTGRPSPQFQQKCHKYQPSKIPLQQHVCKGQKETQPTPFWKNIQLHQYPKEIHHSSPPKLAIVFFRH